MDGKRLLDWDVAGIAVHAGHPAVAASVAASVAAMPVGRKRDSVHEYVQPALVSCHGDLQPAG